MLVPRPRCPEPEPPEEAAEAEAVLEGLAMAGLVAILRQLGDLAELAAEVFDGLQDQVVAASARGRRLALRAKQLQADQLLLPPSIHSHNEHHNHFFCHHHAHHQRGEQQLQHCLNLNAAAAPNNEAGAGRGLHLQVMVSLSHGVVAGGDVPRFILNQIKRCRGPPRLSALDRSQSDGASEKASIGFLSMLRHLKHRQTTRSVSPGGLKLQMQQSCCIRDKNYESTAERRDSSADHSETDASFTSSPQIHMEMDTAKQNHQGTDCYSDAAGSDYVGNCSELQRTSSFEAWLSPGARFSAPEYETTEEEEESSHHRTCSRFVTHAVTSDGPLTDTNTMEAKQDSAAAETSCNKRVSRRYKHKGSIEMVASRVSSLPRKLCTKHQHDAISDSSRSHSAGGLQSNGAFLPVLVADPVFSIQDSVPDSEESYQHQETTILQRTICPSYDASVDAEIHGQQNGLSISSHYSNSSSPENSKDVLLPRPRPQRTGCMIDGSLHVKPTSVLPENYYCFSEDTKVAPPPPLPIPPMQWLSVKVHTGPTTYRKPFGKDHVQRAQGTILKATELPELGIQHSYEGWSEPAGTKQQSGAEVHSQQEPRQQPARADSDKEGPEISSSRGNTVSDSEANKHNSSNASGQGDKEGNNVHDEEHVLFSAVEELAPPWVPRPKHPLPEVASHDRVTVYACIVSSIFCYPVLLLLLLLLLLLFYCACTCCCT
ncbi:hypothetical protein BAE44_0023627 [Dichanthelium oligosanthes]|uniref:Protein SCAR n=1 Tax=Dichanthelium oligosanthes TaxID=888268 RepID=A0A1E5UR40_9POAL|nr:hypothetical protein BAE44_0023627 [Dichanthelium oligosanthes]